MRRKAHDKGLVAKLNGIDRKAVIRAHHGRGVWLAAIMLVAAALPATGADSESIEASRSITDLVYYDTSDEAGNLSGGVTELDVANPRAVTALISSELRELVFSGDPANRIDLVFVGDGYTGIQLGDYASDVDAFSTSMFVREPFATYSTYFNVHRVDVISNESGVDHDPIYGVWRDTALDMGFWCDNIERLLCVDVQKATTYANNAPDVDLIAAIANSSKYGGAGYVSANLSTAAADNSWSPEIMIHEFGHSLGDLGDEYHYFDGAVYTGPEVPEPNLSILDAAAMVMGNVKWADWIGVDDPHFDGLVYTFEGGDYHQYGIYRPTYNSMMNTVGRPFNLPSAQALITEIYRMVRPIDNASPTSLTYTENDTLFVEPMVPVGHSLDIQWFLDGSPIPGQNAPTLELGPLSLVPGQYTVSVEVVDNTPWVRDEMARANWMSDSRTYDVFVRAGVATITANGSAEPVLLSAGENLQIEISFDAGGYVGDVCEYYFAVVINQRTVYFRKPQGWSVNWSPYYQGECVSFLPAPLISFTPAAAQWDWYIIVDNDTNGAIDGTWLDMVEVTVH